MQNRRTCEIDISELKKFGIKKLVLGNIYSICISAKNMEKLGVLETDQIDILFDFYTKHNYLNHIKLLNININDKQLDNIMNKIIKMKYLESIDLINCNITYHGIKILYKHFKLHNNFLTYANINHYPTKCEVNKYYHKINIILSKNKAQLTKKFKTESKVTNQCEIFNFLERYTVNARGKYGETVLHWAAFNGNCELVKKLCDIGMDVNCQDDKNKRTPMMWAILRLFHDGERYKNIIDTLIEKKADLSLRDHNGRNIYEMLNSANIILGSGKLQNIFHENGDKFIYTPYKLIESKSENEKSSILLDGDDSSDEEFMINANKGFDIEKNLKNFTSSGHFTTLKNNLITDSESKLSEQLAKRQIEILFITHCKGLSYLFSPNVNNLYYTTNGKFSLGVNSFKNDDTEINEWIQKSYLEAINDVFEKNFSIDVLKDNNVDPNQVIKDEINSPISIIKASLKYIIENKRKFLRKYGMFMTVPQFIDKMNIYELDDVVEKIRSTQKKKRGPKPAARTILTKSPDSPKEISKKFLEPDQMKFCIEINKQRLNSNRQVLTKQSAQTSIQIFDFLLSHKLYSNIQAKKIHLNRGINEKFNFNLMESSNKINNSLLMFSTIRAKNRYDKRFMRNTINSYKVSEKDSEPVKKLGHYIHKYSKWQLVDNVIVQHKSIITTNLARNDLVDFRDGGHSYESIVKTIEKIVEEKTSRYDTLIFKNKSSLDYMVEYWCSNRPEIRTAILKIQKKTETLFYLRYYDKNNTPIVKKINDKCFSNLKFAELREQYKITEKIAENIERITKNNCEQYYTPQRIDKLIAEQIRSIIQFQEIKYTELEQYKQFLSELTFLLFFIEPLRNPFCFVTHQMGLDLIIANKKSWKDLLYSGNRKFGGGVLSMTMSSSDVKEDKKDKKDKEDMKDKGEPVRCSRYLNELFAHYIPFKYCYEGESISYKSSAAIQGYNERILEFSKRTTELVDTWMKEIHQGDEYSTILEAISNKEKEWYNCDLAINSGATKKPVFGQ